MACGVMLVRFYAEYKFSNKPPNTRVERWMDGLLCWPSLGPIEGDGAETEKRA